MAAGRTTRRMRRRSRSEWEGLLAEFALSGLQSREFCRRHRLNLGTFYWWRSHLRDSRADSSAVKRSGVFVPVEVEPASATSEFVDVVEILLHGSERRARLARDCPPELATAVLQALDRSSCS